MNVYVVSDNVGMLSTISRRVKAATYEYEIEDVIPVTPAEANARRSDLIGCIVINSGSKPEKWEEVTSFLRTQTIHTVTAEINEKSVVQLYDTGGGGQFNFCTFEKPALTLISQIIEESYSRLKSINRTDKRDSTQNKGG